MAYQGLDLTLDKKLTDTASSTTNNLYLKGRRMEKYLFIAGMPKCGTTALAHWLVKEEIAEYLVHNTKEPYIYARSDFGRFSIPPGSGRGLWRLDASVGYALNRNAINNMPEHLTKIIICIRNPFERAWSNYKMHKFFTIKNNNWKNNKKIFSTHGGESRAHCENVTTFNNSKRINKIVTDYYKLEGNRMLEGDFYARIIHEFGFYYTRGNFPFLDILNGGRYTFALRNILEKYSPEDVIFIDIKSLDDSNKRDALVKNFLGVKKDTPPVEKEWTGDIFEINEEKPDFADQKFNFFRSFLAQDLKDFENQFDRHGFSRDFIDFDSLHRNIY